MPCMEFISDSLHGLGSTPGPGSTSGSCSHLKTVLPLVSKAKPMFVSNHVRCGRVSLAPSAVYACFLLSRCLPLWGPFHHSWESDLRPNKCWRILTA